MHYLKEEVDASLVPLLPQVVYRMFKVKVKVEVKINSIHFIKVLHFHQCTIPLVIGLNQRKMSQYFQTLI